MNRLLIATGGGALLLFLLLGVSWVGSAVLGTDGARRSIFLLAAGFFFLGTYVYLMLRQIRVILAGARNLVAQGAIAAAEVCGMLVSFGAVYQQLGLIDNTRPGAPIVHEFWTSVYYSVVTFTTLGYGDFYPQGIGRALAAMQALAGYIILGLLASTLASVVSPHTRAGRPPDDR